MKTITLKVKPGKMENSYTVKNGRVLIAKIDGPSKYRSDWLVNIGSVGREYSSLNSALENIRLSLEQKYNAFACNTVIEIDKNEI